MLRKQCWISAGLVLVQIGLAFGVQVQEWATAGSKTQDPASSSAGPVSAGRVNGQAASQEEADAWRAVDQAPTLAEKAALAEKFLQTYPNSGLRASAHYLIANRKYEAGDFDAFVPEAELVVGEIPSAVDLLSRLAFIYAETRQPDKAIDRATRCLTTVDALPIPLGVSPEELANQVFNLKAEANYALGRAYLDKRGTGAAAGDDLNLRKSIGFLRTALSFDPRHDYAWFRLGFAARNANEAGTALMAYAKAVAVGGLAAEPARKELEDLLNRVQSAYPDSEWSRKSAPELIATAVAELEEETARTQEQKDRLAETLAAAMTPAAEPGAVASPENPSPQ